VPALAARLKVPAKSGEHKSILISAWFHRHQGCVDVLLGTLRDKKVDAPTRSAAEDGIYLSGDKRAVPILMETAKSGYVVVQGQKASIFVPTPPSIGAHRRSEHYDEFKALADKEKEVQGVFGEALDRMQVAKECGDKIDCYGKYLSPSWTRAEKAAFWIRLLGQRQARHPAFT